MKNIKKSKKKYHIAIVDIETGGFKKEKYGMVEIGVIIVDNFGNFIYNWSAIIKPYQNKKGEPYQYGEKAEKVHNISLEMMNEKGYNVEDVCFSFVNIMKHYNCRHIVGHNIKSFDLPWINHTLSEFGKEWEFHNVIDTIELARKLIPGRKSYSLTNLTKDLEIEQLNAHRALSDAQVTYELWQKLEKMK